MNAHQLILVEGIPGSGKSTTAKKIEEYLKEKGINVRLFKEGDQNPADLSWHACIPNAAFTQLLETYPNEKETILACTTFEEDYAIVAYIKGDFQNPELHQRFESYEVYDNRVPFQRFRDLHLKRWKHFSEQSKQENTVSIFECAFLQNHVNELLLFRDKNESEIKTYMKCLLETVQELHPFLLYLSPVNVKKNLEWIGKMRVNEKGEQDWLNRVTAYISECPYGMKNQLFGIDGLAACMEARKHIELDFIKTLLSDSHIIENEDNDWEANWRKVRAAFDKRKWGWATQGETERNR